MWAHCDDDGLWGLVPVRESAEEILNDSAASQLPADCWTHVFALLSSDLPSLTALLSTCRQLHSLSELCFKTVFVTRGLGTQCFALSWRKSLRVAIQCVSRGLEADLRQGYVERFLDNWEGKQIIKKERYSCKFITMRVHPSYRYTRLLVEACHWGRPEVVKVLCESPLFVNAVCHALAKARDGMKLYECLDLSNVPAKKKRILEDLYERRITAYEILIRNSHKKKMEYPSSFLLPDICTLTRAGDRNMLRRETKARGTGQLFALAEAVRLGDREAFDVISAKGEQDGYYVFILHSMSIVSLLRLLSESDLCQVLLKRFFNIILNLFDSRWDHYLTYVRVCKYNARTVAQACIQSKNDGVVRAVVSMSLLNSNAELIDALLEFGRGSCKLAAVLDPDQLMCRAFESAQSAERIWDVVQVLWKHSATFELTLLRLCECQKLNGPRQSYATLVSQFVEAGVDIHLVLPSGATAMLLALRYNLLLVPCLLEHGASFKGTMDSYDASLCLKLNIQYQDHCLDTKTAVRLLSNANFDVQPFDEL